MKQGKPLRVIAVLGVALVVALLLRSIFTSLISDPPPPEMAAVLVAPAPLPVGLLLKADTLTWKTVDASAVQAGDIRKGSHQADKLAGAVLRRPVEDGAKILERDVVFPDAPGFLAAALKPGRRAVSVAIDDVSGNAGLIQPGDYVDLLLTQQVNSSDGMQERKVASETVLSDLRVIAVGQTLHGAEESKTASRPSSQSARTVTVEVKPRDAEKVAVAMRLGNLSLSLRSLATSDPGDEAELAAPIEERQPVWGTDISAVTRQLSEEKPEIQAPEQVAASPTPRVRVFRGSKRGDESEQNVAAQGASVLPMDVIQQGK